ncbi:PLP-dependent aspartate aminotransferase family protein [Euzebya sp.]|uniref:trans-sulfuration enzyme family protein n=1 Tax=Euzebya sp. TaxID=1971409 RepID=UPI00351937A1
MAETSHPAAGPLHPATTAVAAGRPPAEPGQPLNQPPLFASVLRAPADGEYARYGGASTAAVEQAIGALERGTAVVFSSGMAAVSAVVATAVRGRPGLVQPLDGYHGSRALFDSTTGLFTESVDVADVQATIDALPAHGVLWLESPTNPLITVADIEALSDAATAKGAIAIVDSTAATPIAQRPLDLGAHVVVHSVTKYLSGHSDLLMGAVVTRDESLARALVDHRSLHGAIPGPMDCFLALRGIRTLDVRMRRAMASAQVLAERLAAHPAVERVHYPGLPTDPGHAVASRQMDGFGALLSFVLADAATADAVCAGVELVVHATSLGGVETSMERRGRQAGEERTPPGLIRMSVGIEHVEDLWTDLARAIDAASAGAGGGGTAR